MPLFTFEGRREKTGELVTGTREAPSHVVLGQDLLSDGVLLTRFEEQRQRLPGTAFFSGLFNRVPALDRALFARYFSLMLRAGLDVKRALVTLGKQTRSKALAQALEAIYQDIERGKTLADSMERFPGAFPPMFVSFVRVGETTGRLQESLGVVAEQLRKEYELTRAVRGGLIYPAVIITTLITVGLAMMFFVVPRLVEVFEGFEVELPLPTRILIAMSDFFQVYWYLVILGIVGTVVGSWVLYRIPRVRSRVLHTILYIPIIGPIMQKVNVARFTRNLGSLIASGVPFVTALDILGSNTPHPSYAHVFAGAKEHVKQGKALSGFLQDFKRLFPPLVVSVVQVGEETGSLDQVLSETALFYEGEVDQTMKNLTSVLEPVLMVLIGLAVGGLAISVLSPIYELVNVI